MSRIPGLLVALLLAFLCASPSVSHALTLSAEPGADCFSSDPSKCIGGIYTLEVVSQGGDTWLASLSIDLTVGLEIPATTIEQVNLKVANGYDNPVSIVSAPDGAANWTLAAGPLSAGGCSGNNGGFLCLDAVTPTGVASTTYLWQVQFNATSLLAESDWHIGARYASPTHDRGWILSASAAPIPEPGSTALYLLGGSVVALLARQRLVKAR